MTNPSDAESLPNSIPALEELVASYQQQLKTLDEKQKRLFEAEDPKNGIFFANEIHANRQEKNQMQVQMQFAQVRLNRLKMEAEPLF
ncbi:hypothetical protein N1030_16795 [Desulfovibrio mangrovi]|uniref:hypothetical protein n=1 Tax=Desulfovibrio mangrovi TaxID=2976983 RepID=UPI0022479310|nr:hypothetical protein [Desulfovibrio mangrovi]UZP67230.1 hypothetical protein N1030_16795 [Desulfovibrio mangrovi]